MATITKSVGDYKPQGDLDQFFGSGGGGGGGALSGLGAIIGGAIAAGSAAALAGGSSSEKITPGIINPGTGTIPGTEGATAPTEPPKNEEDKQTPPPIVGEVAGENEIKDETSTNVEQPIDNTDIIEMLRGFRDEQWAREDAIRAETQEREDTAMSRAIADARRAGVNVNLVGAQPAESGGGITNATGIDGSIYSAEIGKFVSLLETELNNEFKGDENTKDRIFGTIGNLIQAIIYGLLTRNRTTTITKK